jgi:hypothetical protein
VVSLISFFQGGGAFLIMDVPKGIMLRLRASNRIVIYIFDHLVNEVTIEIIVFFLSYFI